MCKVNNKYTRSTLTKITPQQRQWSRSGFLIVNFERMSYLFSDFPIVDLNK